MYKQTEQFTDFKATPRDPFPIAYHGRPHPHVPGAGCLVDTVGLLAPAPSQSSVSLWNMLLLPLCVFYRWRGEEHKQWAGRSLGYCKCFLYKHWEMRGRTICFLTEEPTMH